MIIVCIILALLVGLLGYLLYINERKLNQVTAYCEAYVRFVGAMYFKVRNIQTRMKEIDRLGAFQADDEVGVIFKNLDQCIDEIHDFISKYVNTADETKKDKKA